jgi:hypothetical protein
MRDCRLPVVTDVAKNRNAFKYVDSTFAATVVTIHRTNGGSPQKTNSSKVGITHLQIQGSHSCYYQHYSLLGCDTVFLDPT